MVMIRLLRIKECYTGLFFVNLSGAVSRARGPIRRKHLRARHLEKRVSGLEEKRGFFLEGRGPDRTKAATGLAIRKGNVLKRER